MGWQTNEGVGQADRIMNWVFGFTVGLLTVITYNRLNETKEPPADQSLSSQEIISAYNAGRSDALKTNPVSWDLDQACLEIWANRQPTR